MSFGTAAVDYELRIDYDRLRRERLEKARKQLANHDLGVVVCFDPNNVRYVTGSYTGEWHRDKMHRYCILSADDEPILYDTRTHSQVQAYPDRYPWLVGKTRPANSWMRGAIPLEMGEAEKLVSILQQVIRERGLSKERVGVDLLDVPLLNALQSAGIQVVDAQQAMLDARLIKTRDEVELLRMAATMVEAAFEQVARSIRPGVRENELVAVVNHTLFTLGSDHVECVNVASGPRTNPHSGIFGDRVVRPGDIVYLDIMHSYNGYRTCYYRTFVCGKPTAGQRELYNKCYDWLHAAIEEVKPGATTADIAKRWPGPETMGAKGIKDEATAFALAFGHGLGMSIWEKPIISRHVSLGYPFPLQENMVFALETYAGSDDGSYGVRIEDEVLVTKSGCEVITRYPSREPIACPTV